MRRAAPHARDVRRHALCPEGEAFRTEGVGDSSLLHHSFKPNREGNGTDVERDPEVMCRAQDRMALYRTPLPDNGYRMALPKA